MAQHYVIPKKWVKRLPALQRLAWALEAFIFRSIIAALRLLPMQKSHAFLARLFARFGPGSRRSKYARLNLSYVFPKATPDERELLVQQVFHSLGLAAGELISIGQMWEKRERYLEFVIDPATAAAAQAGRPLVFVTAHVGAWQLVNLLAPYLGIRITVPYAEEGNPAMRGLFLQLRTGFQVNLVPSEGAVKLFMKEMGAGHSIGLAVDTRLDAGELVDFFGVPAPTNTLPARLALRAKSLLVPVRCERLANGRFRIAALPAIEPHAGLTDTQAKIMDMTQSMNHVFETWIRETPGEWICLKRRWPKSQPPAVSAAVESTSLPKP